MISTKNLSALPCKPVLYQICKSISVLDAIFAEKWIDRYYSFNSKWSDTEEFFEMLNGEGDQVLILFHPRGCVINGMAHEYYTGNKEKLTVGLAEQFKEFIFGEPVNSIGTTFCIWSFGNSKWTCGEVSGNEDGSREMLSIFDGNPITYLNWATAYFELNFSDTNLVLHTISEIYRGEPLTKDMVYLLNNNFKHWQQLSIDLKEINYPAKFEI